MICPILFASVLLLCLALRRDQVWHGFSPAYFQRVIMHDKQWTPSWCECQILLKLCQTFYTLSNERVLDVSVREGRHVGSLLVRVVHCSPEMMTLRPCDIMTLRRVPQGMRGWENMEIPHRGCSFRVGFMGRLPREVKTFQ